MMTDTVVLVLLLVLLAVFSRYLKRRKMIGGLATFPGPTAYPLIGNTIDLIRFKFSMTRAVDYWTKRYGDIYCIWLGSVPTVILSKPQDLEILLSSTKHIDKSELYSLIYPWIGRGLLTSSGKKWHSRRKLITPTFHFRILDQFVEVFNRNSDILVKKLLETEGKEKVDIHAFITLCTLDIICETAMGTKVHAQNDTVSSYVKAVHNSLVTLHERSMKPWLTPDAIFYMLSSGRLFKKSLKVLHDYTREVIKTRQRDREAQEACQTDSPTPIDEDIGIKRRKAFLDQLLDVKDSSNAELTDQDIQEEVDTFMFEGHDTTGAALSFILYNVAAHSEVQEKLVKEMDEIFGDSDRAATTQDIQNMKYSELVVKETLRMYPSVPLFARSLKADLPVTDGYVIPAGSNVGVSCLQMGYNSKHWPEPEKFDPERHLPENSTRRHPFAFVPFSAGPRNCIGQKYAMMEMKATLSKIVRHCKLDVPFAGYKPEVEGQIILKAPKGVLLNISRRKPASEASA